MPTLIAYAKYIDPLVTRELILPRDGSGQPLGQEIATIAGTTYVSLPDGAVLPGGQPAEIAASIQTVTPDAALREAVLAASPLAQVIEHMVAAKIGERYSTGDELKLLRNARSAEYEAYHAYAEECRAWGRDQKAALVAPVAAIAEANAAILTQIQALESKELLPRPVRDMIKKSVAEDAAAIGYTLDQVYALAVALGDAAPEAAKSWKKFKDFDARIQALKEQLQ